ATTSEVSMSTLKLLSYLIDRGVTTVRQVCPTLEDDARGMPALTDAPCEGSGCNACQEVCPTSAITVLGDGAPASVALDLGACIGCGLCVETCPTDTIVADRSTAVAATRREDLVLTNDPEALKARESEKAASKIQTNPFARSVAARVVSCGCSACDAEIGAAGNPIFDIDRFGIQVVASPRFADALVVTGPVGKGMQTALRRCYEAMAEPRVVIAAGTCAISGGVHRGGYTEANGVDKILPVDVYIPGCPPHPWSIIHGVLLAMGRVKARNSGLLARPERQTKVE